jgi:hypothetical protein
VRAVACNFRVVWLSDWVRLKHLSLAWLVEALRKSGTKESSGEQSRWVKEALSQCNGYRYAR